MKSFKQYCEEADENPLLHIIQNDQDFWKKLAELANSNPGEVADLLQIPIESVVKWYGIINHLIKLSDGKRAEKEKNEMLPTGKK